MSKWHKTVAVGLVACLLGLPLGDGELRLEAKARPDPALIKQRIDLLGVGAKVKVELARGTRLRGAISAVEDEAFVLESERAAAPQRVAYEDVAQVKLAKLTYRAVAQPDPVEARRVVVGLGVGRHIVVKTTGGKEYHGQIQAIDRAYFILLPDRQATPVQVDYDKVAQVGPNLSKGAKIAIVAAVVVTVVVAVYIIRVVVALDRAMESFDSD